ncbi:unnamed protein product [Clonostachys rosea]|uniref:Uncharacterized protein n=1 Tax=Bionectria ochroleuca TaxID=29856 RepID=A0ABY6UCZ6_BIOOC|nr:unnamed protein product [Clonostachys rosea]
MVDSRLALAIDLGAGSLLSELLHESVHATRILVFEFETVDFIEIFNLQPVFDLVALAILQESSDNIGGDVNQIIDRLARFLNSLSAGSSSEDITNNEGKVLHLRKRCHIRTESVNNILADLLQQLPDSVVHGEVVDAKLCPLVLNDAGNVPKELAGRQPFVDFQFGLLLLPREYVSLAVSHGVAAALIENLGNELCARGRACAGRRQTVGEEHGDPAHDLRVAPVVIVDAGLLLALDLLGAVSWNPVAGGEAQAQAISVEVSRGEAGLSMMKKLELSCMLHIVFKSSQMRSSPSSFSWCRAW